jgi:hypothetical protein
VGDVGAQREDEAGGLQGLRQLGGTQSWMRIYPQAPASVLRCGHPSLCGVPEPRPYENDVCIREARPGHPHTYDHASRSSSRTSSR